MVKYFQVKNFSRFQHYGDRTPPWIKLYYSVLHNYEFSTLQDASKAHLMLIWLLASRCSNRMPWDEKWIEKQIGARAKINLRELLNLGFIEMCEEIIGLPEPNAELPEAIKPMGRDLKQEALDVLDFLNKKTGRHYQPVEANLQMIMARLKESTVEDCKSVIAKKTREWGTDEKMTLFLRPATLFNRMKFAQYQGELHRERSS